MFDIYYYGLLRRAKEYVNNTFIYMFINNRIAVYQI